VKQVWFAGCHSDIGGRHGKIAFRWMLEEAEAAGLRPNPPLEERPAPTDPQILRESLSRWWRLAAGSMRRPIREQVADSPRFSNESVSPTVSTIHEKVGEDNQVEPIYAPIDVETCENLQRQGTRDPRLGLGVTLWYYLKPYDALCKPRSNAASGDARWRASSPVAPRRRPP
jgi:hypothetical protein